MALSVATTASATAALLLIVIISQADADRFGGSDPKYDKRINFLESHMTPSCTRFINGFLFDFGQMDQRMACDMISRLSFQSDIEAACSAGVYEDIKRSMCPDDDVANLFVKSQADAHRFGGSDPKYGKGINVPKSHMTPSCKAFIIDFLYRNGFDFDQMDQRTACNMISRLSVQRDIEAACSAGVYEDIKRSMCPDDVVANLFVKRKNYNDFLQRDAPKQQ